jgi:molybdenum-dependent DNA-binding transcriptional regulator ModE
VAAASRCYPDATLEKEASFVLESAFQVGGDPNAESALFVCIVECRSISSGGRRLKIPQATLSRHLRLLEEQCGATLLRRDTHGMSLTQTGQRLLADAQTILAHAEAAT